MVEFFDFNYFYYWQILSGVESLRQPGAGSTLLLRQYIKQKRAGLEPAPTDETVCLFLFPTFNGKIEYVQECYQRHDKPDRHIVFADISHQHRTESTSGNTHHDIGRGLFGIPPHPFQSKREDCREHDRHEEERNI